MQTPFLSAFEQLSAYGLSFLYREVIFSLILFIPVFLVTSIYKRKFPYLHFGMWMLVLLRLILPPDWAAPYSARNLFDHFLLPEQQIVFHEPLSGEERGVISQNREEDYMAMLIPQPYPWKSVVFSLWLFGVMFFFILFIMRFFRYYSGVRRAVAVQDERIVNMAVKWGKLFNLKRNVQLLTSNQSFFPFTFGTFRPVIFLPESLLKEREMDALESVIAHEMAHIKRLDSFWIRLQNFIQVLYFFNPVAWYAVSQLNLSRERICDRIVLSKRLISPRQYGQSMVAVLKLGLWGSIAEEVLPGFGNHKKKMILRIKEIMGKDIMKKQRIAVIVVLLIAFGVFLLPMASDTSNAQEPQGEQEIENPNQVTSSEKEGEPLSLPIREGYISSGYGNRIHPVYKKKMLHKGIDVAAEKGTKIYAAADGRVEFTGKKGLYGLLVILQHEDDYQTWYARMDTSLVNKGDKVNAGDVIGRVGNSGLSTAPHLHFELHERDTTLNPQKYINFELLDKTPDSENGP
jgi:beta-lactamase regulating signal transducer with metallopeptidase domain